MKRCFFQFAHWPEFRQYVSQRPAGVNRYEWGRDWLLTHGVAAADIPHPKANKRNAHGRRPHTDRPPAPPRIQQSPAFLLSPEWRRLRMRVLVKRGARCECCGATPADGKTVLNVDHVKPRKYYPELALAETNLQVLCHVCNHGKGNWDETDWRQTG